MVAGGVADLRDVVAVEFLAGSPMTVVASPCCPRFLRSWLCHPRQWKEPSTISGLRVLYRELESVHEASLSKCWSRTQGPVGSALELLLSWP